MPIVYTYTTVSSVPWSPDFTNISVCDQTKLARSADFILNIPPYDAYSFANIPSHFEEGAEVTNTFTSNVITNVGSIGLPNFIELEAGINEMTGSLTQDHIFVGNVSGVATDVAMSQDATILASGRVTVEGLMAVPFDASVGIPNNLDVIQYDSGLKMYKAAPAPGGVGGLSEFGYFWQSVADVGATIAADNGKALFQTASSNNTAGLTTVPASGDIVLGGSAGGVYKISWMVAAAEPGAMAVYINGAMASLAGTTYGSGAGTQQNSGMCILTIPNSAVVSLRTNLCSAALTLQLAGTTDTSQVVTSILLEKIG